MLIATYILIILVSIVLERQERRHQFEQRLEYERHGQTLPPSKPKLPMLESLLNIFLGVFLVTLGILFTATTISTSTMPHLRDSQLPSILEVSAVFLAGGFALIILGWKGVRLNKAYQRQLRDHA